LLERFRSAEISPDSLRIEPRMEARASRSAPEIKGTRPRGNQAVACEVETNLVDPLVPARVLHEQGDLDAVVDV